MQLFLCKKWWPQETHSRESPSIATNATFPVHKLVTSIDILWHIQEKNVSSVTNVVILALEILIWKYTTASIPEKNPSSMGSAISLVDHPLTFNGTWTENTMNSQMWEWERNKDANIYCHFQRKYYFHSLSDLRTQRMFEIVGKKPGPLGHEILIPLETKS